MFKKDVTISNRLDLSRTDSRSIRERMKDVISGSKNDIIAEAKLPGSVKCSIFFQKSSEDPVGFTSCGDEVIPSLYSLWSCQSNIFAVHVPPAVSTFVLRGANLMLPGIQRRGIPQIEFGFPTGAIITVQVLGNPYPVAVGRAILSGPEIYASGIDAKGCAVEILHFFGDGLWKLGSKTIPPGFSFDEIVPHNEARQTAPSVTKAQHPDDQTTVEPVMSSEDMDSLTWGAFYFVARTSSESDVPMNASALYSRMQQQTKLIIASTSCLKRLGMARGISGSKLDLKNSSWKSLSNFLDILVDKNLISSKIIRNERIITRINRDHPDAKAFVPPAAVEADKSESSSREPLVKTWFLMDPVWTALLGGNPEGTRKELTDRLQDYLRQYKGGSIDLLECDERLRKALKNIKSVSIEKKEISKKFNDSLISSYSITNELPPRVRKGNPPVIQIKVKKVAGNKYSTTVTGLHQYGINESDFSADLARIFSVSCSATDKGVYCQGNRLGALVAFVVNEVGIPLERIRT
jgi:translation initiation factor 2D